MFPQNLRLLLLEEKYLELLESNRDLEALHCLRQEIAGLPLHNHEKKQKIQHLAGCVLLYGRIPEGKTCLCGFYHSGFYIVLWFSFSLMMCQNAEELKKMANWAGVKGGSRENLMDNICGKNRYPLCIS